MTNNIRLSTVVKTMRAVMKIIKLGDGTQLKIDDADFDKHGKHAWHNFRGVATRWCKGRIYHLHRLIMNVAWDQDQYVTHLNGDKFDCQKENLAIVDRYTEAHNRPANHHPNKTSKYKGVGLNKLNGKWTARIQYQGRRTTLGYYHNEDDAAEAYNTAATELYGEHAFINILQ